MHFRQHEDIAKIVQEECRTNKDKNMVERDKKKYRYPLDLKAKKTSAVSKTPENIM